MTVRIEKHSLEIEERLERQKNKTRMRNVGTQKKRESGGEISMNYGAEPGRSGDTVQSGRDGVF